MTNHNPFEAFSTSGSMEAEVAYEQYAVHAENGANAPLFASLNKFNQSRALDLARDLKYESYEQILNFGFPAQQQLKQLSTQMLGQIQRKDVSKVGDVLHDLMEHLEKIDPDALIEQEKGFFGKLFARQKQSIQEVMTHYNKLSKRIDRLGIQLAHNQHQLLTDVGLLDKLYTINESYFHEVNVYIASLEVKKQYVLEHVLPQLEQVTRTATSPLAQHQVQDTHMQLEWLDKRLYDLELSREIAIQYAPQIRLIQRTNQLLIDKIQTSVMTTIPMWQTQIAILLNLNHQRRAIETEQRLMDASDSMLRKNAKMIDTTAKHSNKQLQLQNIERFKETQMLLLAQLKESLTIQSSTENRHVEIEQRLLES